MRLHLLLLALALGCATEDAKTDDTSSNGGSGDGDGGSVLSQVAGMVTEMAEMSAKIAAQQATIAQLEMQVAETLRWETMEYTCAATSPEDPSDDIWWETVDSTIDAPEVLHISTSSTGTENWSTYFDTGNSDATASDVTGLTVECRLYSSGEAKKYRITLGYER